MPHRSSGSAPDRWFVLGTGRCGTTALARALSAAVAAAGLGWTVGHESRAHVYGLGARLDYPACHVEADNRLCFFLGALAARHPTAGYVHLTREPEAVARSLTRLSWGPPRRPSPHGIMPAFAGRIVRAEAPPGPARLAAARMYVEATTANVADFLARREAEGRAVLRMRVEEPAAEFAALWAALGGSADDPALAHALHTLATRGREDTAPHLQAPIAAAA